jgi:hypothetical protein
MRVNTNGCALWLWRRRASRFAAIAVSAVVVAVAATTSGSARDASAAFPDLIPLPAGFAPEGIAAGTGHTFYVGSFLTPTLGQILVGDFRTGSLSELVPPNGRLAVGMKYDPRSNLLFVAGGPTGGATIYDGSSGAEIAFYPFLPPGGASINDVAIARQAAYFTDSAGPFLGRIALGPKGEPGNSELIPLPANFGVRGSCTVGPFGPRSNGIAATPDGKHLILVHMSEGQLYLMDTATYTLIPIDVGGGDFAGGSAVCSADGLLLDGTTLYVAQFLLHRVAVVELSPDRLSGVVTRYITEPFASNPAVQFPTTIAEFGSSLYGVTYGGRPPAPDVVFRMPK